MRDDVDLSIAGWVGSEHKTYSEEQFAKLDAAGLGSAYEYSGVISREEKISFLQSIDVFTVPTTYREPKGRFALEAMASGLPVVFPDHGAFPEIINESGCGVLVRPDDPQHLAETLSNLLSDPARCTELGEAGRQAVLNDRNAEAMAKQTLALYESL